MSITTLDVSRLPREALIQGFERDSEVVLGDINLSSIIVTLRHSVDDLARQGLLEKNISFGCAVGTPRLSGRSGWMWDDPYSFTHVVGGWGPEEDRNIANAVRKLRAVLREKKDTLWMRRHQPNVFQNAVENDVEKDGSFLWGDYPWGGGVLVDIGGIIIPVAVSVLLEVEDHAQALHIGGLIGSEMLKRMEPDQFGPGT